MDNTSTIFPEVDPRLQRKYALRITTARIFLFINTGFAFLADFSFYFLAEQLHDDHSWTGFRIAFVVSLLMLFIAILCISKPYSAFLLATITMTLYLLLFLFTQIKQFSPRALIPLSIQIVSLFFIARGMAYAKKSKLLQFKTH